MIAKLEQRVRELETELDGEQRRFQEANKNMQKADRRMRELQFQVPSSFTSGLKAITNEMIAGRRGQEELRTSAGPDRQTPEQTQGPEEADRGGGMDEPMRE